MGNCATKQPLHKQQRSQHTILTQSQSAKMIEQADRQKQIYCLKLIFSDLASREKSQNLNLKNFQSFFHLNWVLGSSLYKKFAGQNLNGLTEKQFICSMLAAFDCDSEVKICYMFSVLDLNCNKGLQYNEFICLLLASPHECLKQILKNQKFLNALGFSTICDYILNSKKQGQISQNNFSLYPSLKYKKFHQQIQQQQSQSIINFDSQFIIQTQLVKHSKQTLTKLLKQKINQKQYSTKLITTYADYIFNSFKLNKYTDCIKYTQFRKIVNQNPLIFQSFYRGFHSYLWKYQDGFPLYRAATPQISDYCIQKIGNITRRVYLVFIKTSFLVFSCNKMKQPLAIRNLQGLQIKSITNDQQYGIVLSHSSSSYPQIIYCFDNQTTQKQWISKTKQFKPKYIESKYKIKQKIGTGTYSQVHKCINRATNQNYAVKIIKKPKQNQSVLRYMQYQSELLAFCPHLMELIQEGNLKDYVQSQHKRGISQQQIKTIMYQLFQAVDRMHSLGIIHRDLKFENILMKKQNGKYIPKIIDFGTAIYKMHIPILQQQLKYVGTQQFKAFQVIKKQEYDEKVDIFSLGVIMFYLLLGRYPFNLKKDREQNKIEFTQFQSNKINIKAKDLLKQILCTKTNRLTSQAVLKHKWFN